MFRRLLTPAQMLLIHKLDDGFDHADSVGKEIDELDPADVLGLQSLRMLGLVEAVVGHSGQVWVRLTEKGRKVREEGSG